MGLPYDKPIKAFGAPKPSTQRRLTRQAERGWERANRRHKMARLAAETPGSLETKADAIEIATKAGLIPMGNRPSRETVRVLQNRYLDGDTSVEDFLDGRRDGRPLKSLPSAIEEEISRVLDGGFKTNPHQLTADLRQLATRLGVEAPTYHDVHRRFAEAGRLRRAAAQQGSRAAELYASAHTTVPSRHTHDVWALDELTVPVWTVRWAPHLDRYESFDRDLVIVVDLKSTAVVGWDLVDPSRRVDAEGNPAERGFDQKDVLAALMNAACPELAPDSTRPFAGYLPNRLRWDNAQPHKSLARWVDDSEGLDFDVRRIQKRRPDRNGAAENRVNMLKASLSGVRGHKDHYVPTDRITNDEKADLARHRTEAAADGNGPVTRKIPINPEQLLDEEGLRAEIDRAISRYNFEHVNKFFGARPVDMYHQHLAPKTPRRGHDLVRALEPHTTLVTTKGIRHYADDREFRFTAEVDGALLMVDKEVTYYADPLHRGLFLLWNQRLHFVRPNDEPSEKRAARYARSWAAVARSHSDEAAAIRDASFIVDLGAQALQESQFGYAAAVERHRDSRNGDGAPHQSSLEAPRSPTSSGAQKKHGPQEDASPATPEQDPWSDGDPSAFVRKRK